MSYREFPPPPDLAEYVACTWTNVCSEQASVKPQPILPDGCSDIIQFEDEEPHVAGPASITQWLAPLPQGTTITGLRLRPAAVRAVLGCHADLLLNQDAPLTGICGSAARPLLIELDAAEKSRRGDALLRWVRIRLERNKRTDQMARHIAKKLMNPTITVDDLTAELGWNARRIHREMVASAGYGPKRLQRIMRVQRAIRLSTRARSLADLAAASGFSDQSHMVREFREITLFTPAGYLAQGNLNVGQWMETDGELA